MNSQSFLKKGGHFGTLKVSDFFNMENTDGLHKFPVSGGTGSLHFVFLMVWGNLPRQLWTLGSQSPDSLQRVVT